MPSSVELKTVTATDLSSDGVVFKIAILSYRSAVYHRLYLTMEIAVLCRGANRRYISYDRMTKLCVFEHTNLQTPSSYYTVYLCTRRPSL